MVGLRYLQQSNPEQIGRKMNFVNFAWFAGLDNNSLSLNSFG